MEKNKEITINVTLTGDKLVLKSTKEGLYYEEYKCESLMDNSNMDNELISGFLEYRKERISKLYPESVIKMVTSPKNN